MRTKTAAIVIIGDEILSGRTLDTNTQTIARMLSTAGIAVREVRVIPDDTEVIVHTVNALRPRVDYLFTTGGIGPTHDDKTALAMAQAFHVGLGRNEEAWRRLCVHYQGAANINEGRAKMADIPIGAGLIDNPVSTAPGFYIENVYVLAGVPTIMQAMLEGILPTLEGGARVHSRSIGASVGESALAAGLAAIEAAHEGVSVGSYPRFSPTMKPHTTIVVRGVDQALVETAIDEVAALMRRVGASPEPVHEES